MYLFAATRIENRKAQFKETTQLSTISKKTSTVKSKERFHRLLR